MDSKPEHRRSSPWSDITLAAVVAAVVCCAVPLLVAAGLLSSAGVLLDRPLLSALGVAVLAWALLRAGRRLRARQQSAGRDTTARSEQNTT